MCVCVCVCVRVRACACACARNFLSVDKFLIISSLFFDYLIILAKVQLMSNDH